MEDGWLCYAHDAFVIVVVTILLMVIIIIIINATFYATQELEDGLLCT
jgi:hypothetical protein